MLGHLLDLDPALGRADQGHPAGLAVDQQTQIQFAGDVAALLDIDPLDLASRRPGLVGDEVLAEQCGGRRRDLVLGSRQPDPAGLAAAAGMDLRLDHPDLAAEPTRRRNSLGRGIGDAAARRLDAEFRQQLLAAPSPPYGEGRGPLRSNGRVGARQVL